MQLTGSCAHHGKNFSRLSCRLVIGMGPASDYTPFTLNDDKTRGGYARLAALITTRREA